MTIKNDEFKNNRFSVLLPGKSHGWCSKVGYSTWDYKESDTTEQLHFTSLHETSKAFYRKDYIK